MLAEARTVTTRPRLALVPRQPGDRYSGPRKRLVAEPAWRGRWRERHIQSTRLVVDDYGDAVAMQWRCPACLHWHSDGGDSSRRCRPCDQWRMARRRSVEDPAKRRAQRAAAKAARYARDPDARERDLARVRSADAERRLRDPERERALGRQRTRRYAERRRQDPERHLERLELTRIDSVLRGMAAGKRTGRGRRVDGTGPKWVRRSVASAPLAVAVARAAATLDGDPAVGERMVADLAGLSPRLLWGWRTGDRRRAMWDAADLVLVAIDRFWWEVFDPQDAVPGLFSGVRSRDVTGWVKAALDAVELWGDA